MQKYTPYFIILMGEETFLKMAELDEIIGYLQTINVVKTIGKDKFILTEEALHVFDLYLQEPKLKSAKLSRRERNANAAALMFLNMSSLYGAGKETEFAVNEAVKVILAIQTPKDIL